MGVDAINMDIGNQKSETCLRPAGAGLRHGESHLRELRRGEARNKKNFRQNISSIRSGGNGVGIGGTGI